MTLSIFRSWLKTSLKRPREGTPTEDHSLRKVAASREGVEGRNEPDQAESDEQSENTRGNYRQESPSPSGQAVSGRSRHVIHWFCVIFIPLLVSGFCTYFVNQATFPEVSLHVRIVDAVSSSVPGSPALFPIKGSKSVQPQREFAITILNVGSLPADREDNVLNVKFTRKIDVVYMAESGVFVQGAVGDTAASGAASGPEECVGAISCHIRWQTVDPMGQANLRFAFSNPNQSVTFKDFPYVAHGGKKAEKWICCGMSDSFVEECEQQESHSLMPNFRTLLMAEDLACPQV